jgi:hypothetical protein
VEATLEDMVERLVGYWRGCRSSVRQSGEMPAHIEFLLDDLSNRVGELDG